MGKCQSGKRLLSRKWFVSACELISGSKFIFASKLQYASKLLPGSRLLPVKMLLSYVLIIVLFTCWVTPALGTSPLGASTLDTPPTLVAISEGELPSRVPYSEIEEAIDSYVEKHESTTAAVSVAVFNSQAVLLEKSYGYSDIENEIANNQDTVFEWGSITKLLVWVSVMQLAEQGKIDLEEDIRTYLPEGFLRKIKYDHPITMLNLMNHNAGWQETSTNLFIADKDKVKGLGETLQLIEPDQVHKPGSVVAYSNWGSALAGFIVEQVSGQSFDTYVQQHICGPLDMKHTALNPTLSDNPWVAAKRSKQKHYATDNQPLGASIYHISLYPAGMATGTMGDFIRFGQALLGKEGNRSSLFRHVETLEEMFSPSLYFADSKTPRNCHGFWTDQSLGVPVLWHNGGTLGSSSWLAFDPVSGIGMITLTNQPQEQVYNGGLLPLVFGEYKEREEILPQEDISGRYLASRSIFKGYAKPYSLLNGIKLVAEEEVEKGKEEEKARKYAMAGSAATLTHVGPGAYLLDTEGSKKYVIYASTNDKGQTVLQFPGQDYIETNPMAVAGKFVLVLLFAVAGLYGLIALMFTLIGFLKDRKSVTSLAIYRTVVNASVAATVILFTLVSLTLLSGSALIEDIRWRLVVIGILSLVPVVYVGFLLVKWKQLDPPGKERIKLIATAAAGVVMTINVIFWETYKFW